MNEYNEWYRGMWSGKLRAISIRISFTLSSVFLSFKSFPNDVSISLNVLEIYEVLSAAKGLSERNKPHIGCSSTIVNIFHKFSNHISLQSIERIYFSALLLQ